MIETMAAAVALLAVPEDLLCTMIKMLQLMMPFIQCILFGMHLVNLKETQVVQVCC
jgi:hypothetical protein